MTLERARCERCKSEDTAPHCDPKAQPQCTWVRCKKCRALTDYVSNRHDGWGDAP